LYAASITKHIASLQ